MMPSGARRGLKTTVLILTKASLVWTLQLSVATPCLIFALKEKKKYIFQKLLKEILFFSAIKAFRRKKKAASISPNGRF